VPRHLHHEAHDVGFAQQAPYREGKYHVAWQRFSAKVGEEVEPVSLENRIR
jgi:hypothetical protein